MITRHRFLILHILLSCFFSFGICSEKSSLLKQENLQKCPEVIMRNLTLQEINDINKMGWRIHAEKGTLLEKANLIECTKTTCILLENQKEMGQIESSAATINKEKQYIHLTGSVIATFNGITLTGSDVHYTLSNQSVSTQNTAHYNHALFHLTAQKSVAHLKNKKIEFSGGVTSEFRSLGKLLPQ